LSALHSPLPWLREKTIMNATLRLVVVGCFLGLLAAGVFSLSKFRFAPWE
jgi:hypothetical protein